VEPGFIAGSPTPIGKPTLVTVPTPLPDRKLIAEELLSIEIVTTIRAPWVTSGSSPASFITAAIALVSASLSFAKEKETLCPFGKVISTGSGNCPVIKAVKAALAAAVAHAPVVQPLRREISVSDIVMIPLIFRKKILYDILVFQDLNLLLIKI
jgi:hypothetical protein